MTTRQQDSKWRELVVSLVVSNGLFWYYIKQIMNAFIRAMVRIFSFGERWNVPFNSAIASLNGTFHLSPHENILTIALITIHYLYNVPDNLMQTEDRKKGTVSFSTYVRYCKAAGG